MAQGGAGGAGANSGNGEGGGLFVGAPAPRLSTRPASSPTWPLVAGPHGGSRATASAAASTSQPASRRHSSEDDSLAANYASTSDSDIYGTVTISEATASFDRRPMFPRVRGQPPHPGENLLGGASMGLIYGCLATSPSPSAAPPDGCRLARRSSSRGRGRLGAPADRPQTRPVKVRVDADYGVKTLRLRSWLSPSPRMPG